MFKTKIKPNKKYITITIPDEYLNQELEIIMRLLGKQEPSTRKKIKLTTALCHGKKADFSRKDIYEDRI